MQRPWFRTCLASLAALLFLAAPASAHRVHAGVTEIAVNPRTGEMEIVHRVFAHDLMTALDRDAVEAYEFLETGAGLETVGVYARERFRMADGEGELYDLAYVGAEVDGEFAWIYFVAPEPGSADAFIVDNDILADTFDDQVMMTNLHFNAAVRTAMQGPGRRAPVRVRFER